MYSADWVFAVLEEINNFLWGYVCSGIIVIVGIWLSCKSRWIQIFRMNKIVQNFLYYCKKENKQPDALGADPIKVFFASLGGCIGIGNLVTVAGAIQVGGPGALIWLWVAALLGSIIKYAEIYLGIEYRLIKKNRYVGGPMYFLAKAFPKHKWIPVLMALMLCIYGVEIYMFSVIKESVAVNFSISPQVVTISLILLILLGVSGGVDRIGSISEKIVPLFVLVYTCMTLYIFYQNLAILPSALKNIICAAFSSPTAAVGGVTGGVLMVTIAKGIATGCYTGDIGVGYASIIHSEAYSKNAAKQAGMAVFTIYIDTFLVCTCTVLLLVLTDTWKLDMDASLLVQVALSSYFPYSEAFMPLFLFVLGYSTIIAYMLAGVKCAKFISPNYGTIIYYIIAIFSFYIFSYYPPHKTLTIMNFSGACLMLINIAGIIKLHDQVKYNI